MEDGALHDRSVTTIFYLLSSILHSLSSILKTGENFLVYYLQCKLSIEPYRLRCYFDQVAAPSPAYTVISDSGCAVLANCNSIG